MRVTIVLPSLNPDDKLLQVVDALVERGFHRILLVNDGSDQEHLAPFEQAARHPQCVLLRHAKNLGKGRALKTAFNYFLCHPEGDVGVVTVDGDNQHHIDDIVACAQALEAHPDALILGCREFSGPDVPPRSRIGNRTASFLFRVLAGVKVSDTQTGLRAIPSRWLWEFVDLYGERFEYETNMLLEVPRLGISLREQPIRTIYLEENVGSHFRPVQDTLRIARLLGKFLASSLASFVVDILLFWLLEWLLTPVELALQLLLATVGARVVSSLVNYSLNRKAVFGHKGRVGGSMARYYLLCVVQTAASYIGVWALTALTGGAFAVLWKVVVDLVLFFISFQIQREWVFPRKQSHGR